MTEAFDDKQLRWVLDQAVRLENLVRARRAPDRGQHMLCLTDLATPRPPPGSALSLSRVHSPTGFGAASRGGRARGGRALLDIAAG
jgi:hypothetical protein